jgi:DNA-binding NarL/FixJ family response regulator
VSGSEVAPRIRVVVADDQAVMRSGLRMILDAQADIEVVGEADDGAKGVELVRRLDPDVVLMDIRMPVLDGIAATRQLRDSSCRSRVLILTTYAVDDNLYEALRAGASGFFAKTDAPDQIVAAVRSAAAGDTQLGRAALQLVLDRYIESPTSRPPAPDLQLLTDREREVLLLLGRGSTNAEIADELIIGEATVKTHVARVITKLGLRDRTQAVVYCYEHGLLRPGR